MNILKQKKDTLKFNQKLLNSGLVFSNFGNLSIRYKNSFLIKPSGINLSSLKPNEICNYASNNNKYKPSVDSPIHEIIYQNFKDVNSIIHTHSTYATAFAQANKSIKCLGTTHADYFASDVPVIPVLNKNKISNNYEKNIGLSIVNFFKIKKIDHNKIKACLLQSHGVIVWGKSAEEAFELSLILEKIAELNFITLGINSNVKKLNKFLQQKHFNRKHGINKYYGQ